MPAERVAECRRRSARWLHLKFFLIVLTPLVSQAQTVSHPAATQTATVGRVSARWAGGSATAARSRSAADWTNRRLGVAASTTVQQPRFGYPVVRATHSEAVQPKPITGKNPSIRLANQLEPLDPFDNPFTDPFDDPFGDGQTQPQRTPRQPPPPPVTQAPSRERHVPTVLEPAPSVRELAPHPVRQIGDDPAPLPPPPEEESPSDLEGEDPDCDRVYNGRNCCEESESCRVARELVRNRSIRDISIDITPQLTLAKMATGDRTYEQEVELSLAEAPSRAWRDRLGNLVADGRLVDFRDGRIHIRQDDGQIVRIPFGSLSEDDSCFVTAWWSIPSECRLEAGEVAPRNWLATTLTWKASALCHKPLYFEEVQLERYGHTAGPFLQPIASGAHFFLNVATLPYQMGINPPNECEYALGYYRPGNCAPWLVPPIPLSVKAALIQAGALVGGFAIVP